VHGEEARTEFGDLGWPAEPGARITAKFGVSRTSPTPHKHAGLDIAIPEGTAVLAAADGVVTVSEWKHGYGNVVYLDHGDEYETRYAHNRENLVAVDERITRGQRIAMVGTTGHSTGPHIHFEILKDQMATDPLAFYRTHPWPEEPHGASDATPGALATRTNATRVPRTASADADVEEQCAALDAIRELHVAVVSESAGNQEWIAYGYALATCLPDTRVWEALRLTRVEFRKQYIQPFFDTDHTFPELEPALYRRLQFTWGDAV
jgi:hypothetical protein